MWGKFITQIKQLKDILNQVSQKHSFTPSYRVVEIHQTETDDHIVTVQIINKSIVFETRPEEVLAHDHLVNQFSPCDVRTLTYLGYLSINNPQYRILAQRLSENNDKVLFALRKKGDEAVIIKTADEILKEKDILDNLGAKDSHVVGYTVASENILREKAEKQHLANKDRS